MKKYFPKGFGYWVKWKRDLATIKLESLTLILSRYKGASGILIRI